ncbi:MAG: hypothetical protein Q9217_003581 [Psora testacea]
MVATPSGRQCRPKKLVKSGTTSTRKHRFESFNQRIAKLQIDPIRRRRRGVVEEDDLADAASFFTVSLEQWKDLNLSENFVNFVREVEPLCQSLPQILHYSQHIFEILASHIKKQDVLSLQPLLDLLSNFAHDLDVRFEAYMSKALSLVATVAARDPNVEVIEWSFTCLAWLFKYLSRLLVPNLRPLFQIMGPLLGKRSQKMHITKFAAEAMSFLVRKAATAYPKHPEYLQTVIDAIEEGFDENVRTWANSNIEQFQYGIMTLLINAIKGVCRQLSSSGIHIYQSLITRILNEQTGPHMELQGILYGVTIALIHHSDAEGLKPVLKCVLDNVAQVRPNTDGNSISTLAHLVFLLSTVRKGSRIQDWQSLVDASLNLLERSRESNDIQMTVALKMAAVVLQSAPLNIVLPSFQAAMETIARGRHEELFLPFCNYFNDLGRERFQDLLMPYLSKFITANWESHRLPLLLSLPKLIGPGQQKKPEFPDEWQQHAIWQFLDLEVNHGDVFECFQFLEALDYLAMTPESKKAIMEVLGQHIGNNLQIICRKPMATFFLGVGLRTFAQNSINLEKHIKDWWHLICQNCSIYSTLPPFLEAILVIIKSGDTEPFLRHSDSLLHALIENLHSSSHELRNLSLQILKQICSNCGGETTNIFDTALVIENSPLDLQSARFVSMQARQLVSTYAALPFDSLLRQAIPHFCFGMLTYNLSQVWEDAVAALKVICQTKCGEDVVSMLAFAWLEHTSSNTEHPEPNGSKKPKTKKGPLSEFECSNLADVETIINDDTNDVLRTAEIVANRYNFVHTIQTRRAATAPALALRVLGGVPHIAEKRSRSLVPHFLSWATFGNGDSELVTPNESEILLDDEEHPSDRRWGQKDRKAMLDLFCQFNNPRVLYRADDVFNALKGLLSNGDVDIQRSALQALFTWKLPELRPYQENLMCLLDDARFREELATFLHVEDQSSIIQNEHRAILMPVLLRLLYGKVVARGGAKGGQGAQIVKRKAVLEAIYRLDKEHLREFVGIALGELNGLDLFNNLELDEHRLVHDGISARKQLGLVNMMKNMLEVLGSKLKPFAQVLIEALLYCLLRAVRQLSTENASEPPGLNPKTQISLDKAVRQVGMQCLNLTAQCFSPDLFRPYLSTIFAEILSPRLDNLPIETAQSVSGILQLFSTWASSPGSVSVLVDYDARTLRSVTDCVVTLSCKDDVKLFVLDNILLRSVECVRASESDIAKDQWSNSESLCHRLLRPNSEHMLDRLGILLQGIPSKDVLASGIRLVAALAPFTEGSPQTQVLLKVSTFLLDQPSHRVSPRSKGELLQILVNFLPGKSTLPLDLQEKMLNTISALFGYFKDRGNRLILSSALRAIATDDKELENAALLCDNLNAYSAQKVDQPDFDLRLKAFNTINESQYRNLSAKQWRPLLFNMLFYVQDKEELAIRSSASFALRRFVEASSRECGNARSKFFELVKDVLLPALRKGASESTELVRTEYLSIMAHLVRHHQQWQEVSDMNALLVNNDDEASFFTNILHIQQHRRLRALRRLATEASKTQLRSSNVAHFFVPLIEHFIFDKADDEAAYNLSAESVTVIGALAAWLEWPQYKAIFRRFSSYIQTKPEVERSIFKLLGVVIDALSEAAALKEKLVMIRDAPIAQADVERKAVQTLNTLAKTMPKQDKLAEDLNKNILPSLTAYLHDKDKSTVSLRVPVAISITKLLKLLPQSLFEERLPPMLTDVCNILRSRAQESRDLSRKTLSDIATLIGSAYFGFMLNELRSALARGYQLHVLSYTVHSILVATAEIYRPGHLDYCLPQIVAVIMDDIFGTTGQEKDAEEYISKMKEVRSSKSYNSMELIAKQTSVDNLAHLIRPLQSLLGEKLDLRLVKKIDELLRRISVGLLRNEAIQDQRILIFCHEIIQEVYKTPDPLDTRNGHGDRRMKRFLIKDHGADKTAKRRTSSLCKYKLTRFAFDILKTVFHKHNALQTPSNIHGFIPTIGDAIIESNEETQTSALRLLTTIIKVPLKSIDENAGIYVAECVKIVRASTSTNVELAQAALKLVSAILRERRTVEIRETDLAYLLKRLIPDLEEPDKQGIAFNFLKAIMTRKIVLAEVYEVLDVVGTIMVTNQTRSARDMARGAYFQFIMDYPQSKDRFSKQLGFLARNLNYTHLDGRQSVMEAIHLLFIKTGEDVAQNIFGTFFVPLVMVIVNDESSQCREMAGVLLRTLFERADTERIESFLATLRSWLGQENQPLLTRVAIQLYGVYLDANGGGAEKDVAFLHPKLVYILKVGLKQPSHADWELPYFGLEVIAKVCRSWPSFAFGTATMPLWASVRQCLSFPHAWVKLSAAKLIGLYFADFAKASANCDKSELLLKGSNGLWLTEQEIIEVARASLGLLKVPGVSEELANQSVRNLVFLGKVMGQTSMSWPLRVLEPQDISEEDNGYTAKSDEEMEIKVQRRSAVSQLIHRSCNTLRRPPHSTRAASLIPLLSTLQLLAVLVNHFTVPTLRPLVHAILLPLHNLTDTSIPTPFSTDPSFQEGYKTLVSNARELMSKLQEKFGTTEYVNALHDVRERVKERREGRRTKRAIERVVDPEKAGREKQRKGEKKRQRRKGKSEEERGRRRGWRSIA